MINFNGVFKRKKYFYTFLFTLCTLIQPANIIFDMNGVLVKQSRFFSFMQIGFTKFLGIYNPFALDQQLFDFLDLCQKRRPETAKAMDNGKMLPQIMCDWLSGEKTNEEIRIIIQEKLEKNQNIFFNSAGKRELIAAMCELIFTPKKFVNTIFPIKDALKLVKKCSKTPDKFGNKNRIFILTNWDAESFALLYKQKKLKKIFNLCDGIIVSGSIHLLKPEKAIYEYVLNNFNLDPEKEITVFVDDTPENVFVAKQCGIHGIHCRKRNIHAVEKEFYDLGILSK